jgi:CRISPR type III-A-associated protein Csm2
MTQHKYSFSNIVEARPQQLNSEARALADSLRGVKTHQLRNFYAAVGRIRRDYNKLLKDSKEASEFEAFQGIELELMLLQPRLAYAAGRERRLKDKFFDLMEFVINGIINAPENQKGKAMKNFFALAEGIIGYHKFIE